MYDTSNDLASTTRRSASEMLNEHLADAIDLHLQAKQAHWNIKGPNFVGLHELFDRIAAQAGEYSDLIAERAVALGGVAQGTLQVVSAQSQLREYPSTSVTGGLTYRRCRMRSRHSAAECGRPSMTQQR
jgi:starvation-inducible DNA-binding protein